jgi:hypothetical protein
MVIFYINKIILVAMGFFLVHSLLLPTCMLIYLHILKTCCQTYSNDLQSKPSCTKKHIHLIHNLHGPNKNSTNSSSVLKVDLTW